MKNKGKLLMMSAIALFGVTAAVTPTFDIPIQKVSAEDTTFDTSSKVPTGLTASTTVSTGDSRGIGYASKSWSLTTSNSFNNVTKVVVNAASNGTLSNMSISITVGGANFGSEQTFVTKDNTDYTFTGNAVSGVVVIKLNNTQGSKTIWVKNVVISTGAGGGDDTGGDESEIEMLAYQGATGDYDDFSYATDANGGNAPTSTRLYAKNKFTLTAKNNEKIKAFKMSYTGNTGGKNNTLPSPISCSDGTPSSITVQTGFHSMEISFATPVNSFTLTLGGSAGNIEPAHLGILLNKVNSPLSSISLENVKSSYYQGDELVKPTVKATYENSDTKDVTSKATITGFSTAEVGNHKATISYTENNVTKTVDYSYTVQADVLNSLTLGGNVVGVKGQAWDLSGVTLTGSFATGTKTITGFTPTTTTSIPTANGTYDVVVSVSYGGQSTSKTYSVTVKATGLTEDDAFSVTEALEIIDSFKGSATTNNGKDVYVKGTVKDGISISTSGNSQGAVTFNLTDGSNTIVAYSLWKEDAANKVKWTTDDIKVNDKVIVHGYLLDYVSNNTHKAEVGYASGSSAWAKVLRNNHSVTTNLTGCSLTVESPYDFDTALNATLVANTGYNFPASISMTVGGAAFTDFTYNSSTGAISIAAGKVTGDLVISGTAAKKTFTITNNLTGVTSSNTTTSLEYGSSFETTLSAAAHHKVTGVTVTMGGTTQSGAYNSTTGKVSIANVTGNVVITASSEEYAVSGVTLDQEDCMLSAGGSITVEATVSPEELTDRSVSWADTPNGLEVGTDYTLSIVDNAITLRFDAQTKKSGTVTLTATAQGNGGAGHSASITITLSNYELTGVAVTGSPVATQYTGHAFDATGLSFAEVYNNGDKTNPDAKAITATDITWNPLVAGQAPTGTYTHDGYAPVTVTILGVTVVENKLKSIEIQGDLANKSYFNNASAFNFAGLTVSGLMTSGEAATITQANVHYEADLTPATYLSTSATKLVVTATYGEKTATKDITGITVTERKITKLEVTSQPKTSYILGEDFTSDGLVVKATYNDGTTDTNFKGYTLNKSAINNLAEGTYQVSVELEGALSASFNVTYNKLVPQEAIDQWTKVTSAPTSWAGEYLLAYESGSTANVWTGVDKASCFVTAQVSNGVIATKPEGAASVIIEQMTEGYAIKVNGGEKTGQYIQGAVGSNTISFTSEQAANSFELKDNGVEIISGGYLRYNANSGNDRFRFFKDAKSESDGYYLVKLFKYEHQEGVTASPIAMVDAKIASGLDLKIGDKVTASQFSASILKNDGDKVNATNLTINGGSEVTLTGTSNTITVSNGTFSQEVVVTARAVVKVSGITVTGSTTPMFAGQTQTLTATVAPETADNKAVTWLSSDESVATVDAATGVVTAQEVAEDGKSATITATAADGSGVTGTFVVYVDKDDVNGIALVSAPTKVSYKYGETFDPTGLKIKEVYESGKFGNEIEYDSSTFTLGIEEGATLDHTKTSCSVTYGGFSLATPIALTINKVPQSVEITEYAQYAYQGGTYDLGPGAVATVTYSDGSTGEVTIPENAATVDTSTVGAVSGTVTLEVDNVQLTDTISVTIEKDEIDTITIDQGPANYEYDHHAEFNPEGMVVIANFKSGHTETVQGTDSRLSFNPATLDTVGKNTITVTFTDDQGNTAQTTLGQQVVVNKTLSDVTLDSFDIYKDYDPNGTNTPLGPQDLIYQSNNITIGAHVTYTYSDDSTATDVVFVPITGLTEGNPTKQITIEGHTLDVQFTNVQGDELISIELDTAQMDLTGYIEGQSVDLSDLVIKTNYESGATGTLSLGDCTITGNTNLTVGENTITVTFNGKSDTFTVNAVEKSVASIELVGTQTETYFLESELDDIVANGYQVKVNYDNGTDETKDITAAMVSVENGVVTITYEEKTATYNITVLTKDIASSITLQNTSGNATKDVDYTFDPGTVTAHFENTDKTLVLDAADYTVDAVAVNEVGGPTTYYVTLNGTEIKAEFAVTVAYADVTGVTISGDTTGTFHKGETANLTAAVGPENANQAVTWSVDDDSIAEVVDGVVTFKDYGTVVVTATSVQDPTMSASVTLVCEQIHVESVEFSEETATVVEESNIQLEWTINPTNAENTAVTFESSDTSVATVDADGKVTGVAPGTATITVKTVDGEKVDTIVVTVTPKPIPVTNITVSGQTGGTYLPGSTVQLTATVTPDNADNKNVIWTSSNTSIATVSADGLVTFKKEGAVTITVTSAEDPTIKATVVVVCEGVHVTGVEVISAPSTLVEGETQQAIWKVSPNDAEHTEVTFISSDESVAKVNENGVVTAVGAGTATITIKTVDGNKTATFDVTVTARTVSVEGVSLNETTKTVEAGNTITLVATVNPENASNKAVTWESSDTSIATVNASGVVTGLKAGEVTITVKTADGSKTATCVVTVTGGANGSSNKAGCFGSVAATSALVSLATLAGAGLALSKKRKKEDK